MTLSFATSEDDMAFTQPQLAAITARALIVHGDRDPLYPVELAIELFRGIPGSALWVVPNGGHGPIFGPMAGRSGRQRSPTCDASSGNVRRQLFALN